MRVLMWMVPGGNRLAGGHLRQLESTASALSLAGVDVAISHAESPELDHDLDLVHGFGLRNSHVAMVRKAGIPVCISPIYWAKSYRRHPHQAHASQILKNRVRSSLVLLRAGVAGQAHEKAEALIKAEIDEAMAWQAADMLLPNSHQEGLAIEADYGVSTPWRFVPNAIERDAYNFQLSSAQRDEASVVCLGRIEPHKNQLGVIRAFQGSRYSLSVIGRIHPDHQPYFQECRQAAETAGYCISTDLDDVSVKNQLLAANIHVLASWFETTGLASLEAAACGASIVSTSRGYADEYFSDEAEYCDPGSPKSIIEATDRAAGRDFASRSALAARIHASYTWERAAEATLASYRELLGHS